MALKKIEWGKFTPLFKFMDLYYTFTKHPNPDSVQVENLTQSDQKE